MVYEMMYYAYVYYKNYDKFVKQIILSVPSKPLRPPLKIANKPHKATINKKHIYYHCRSNC